jgi:cardiolipin synthase A/B
VALIGSSNMDIWSFAMNSEVSVLIYDSSIVARLRLIQERYFAKSHLLSREEWDQRPLWAQFAQNIARLADSFL